MAKKKGGVLNDEINDTSEKKKGGESLDEDSLLNEDSAIDPAIIEDTFTDEFAEYNDVDDF